MKNSEKASYSSIESINPKSDQWSLIPMTTQLIFPHQQVSTSHLPIPHPPSKSKCFPITLASRDYNAQLSPPQKKPSILSNASTPIPHPLWKNLSVVRTPSHIENINNNNKYVISNKKYIINDNKQKKQTTTTIKINKK